MKFPCKSCTLHFLPIFHGRNRNWQSIFPQPTQGAKETGRRQEMKQESCFIGLVVGALTNAVNISTVNPKWWDDLLCCNLSDNCNSSSSSRNYDLRLLPLGNKLKYQSARLSSCWPLVFLPFLPTTCLSNLQPATCNQQPATWCTYYTHDTRCRIYFGNIMPNA